MVWLTLALTLTLPLPLPLPLTLTLALTSVVESWQKASAVLQSSGMPWLKLRVGSGLKPTRPYST